jgi:hypothetical protein
MPGKILKAYGDQWTALRYEQVHLAAGWTWRVPTQMSSTLHRR